MPQENGKATQTSAFLLLRQLSSNRFLTLQFPVKLLSAHLLHKGRSVVLSACCWAHPLCFRHTCFPDVVFCSSLQPFMDDSIEPLPVCMSPSRKRPVSVHREWVSRVNEEQSADAPFQRQTWVAAVPGNVPWRYEPDASPPLSCGLLRLDHIVACGRHPLVFC